MFPRFFLLPALLIAALPSAAEHISWSYAKHYPQIRHELTEDEKATFSRLSAPLPTTAGHTIEWDSSTRTLTTRSWSNGEKQGTARFAEQIQQLSEDGMQLTTLRRSRLHGSDWDDFSLTTHTAAKPFVFVYPPSLVTEDKSPIFEKWIFLPNGQLRHIERDTAHTLDFISPTAPLKEPKSKLMDGVEPFPAPADEPILTGRSNCHRPLKRAAYDTATRTLTWECRCHPGKRQVYKAPGPINIYQFRVAPDNQSVEITRRIYLYGHTAPVIRTCRLTTSTPGDFTDSYGNHYYFTLTPDGHIAAFSRSPEAHVKRLDRSRAPFSIYP